MDFIDFFIASVSQELAEWKKDDANGDSVTTFSDCRLMNILPWYFCIFIGPLTLYVAMS